MNRRCDLCRFFRLADRSSQQHAVGECRRNPPIATESHSSGRQWVTVDGDDWCGEFQPKDSDELSMSEFKWVEVAF